MGAYATLWLLFLLLMEVTRVPWPGTLPALDFLILCLAAFRLTEIVTEEKVARAVRAPFCDVMVVTREDGSEAEEEVPAGRGLRRVAGELVLCPWCAGVWISTLLAFFYILLPGPTRVVALAFGIAAGGLLFQILTKLLDRTRKSIPEEV